MGAQGVLSAGYLVGARAGSREVQSRNGGAKGDEERFSQEVTFETWIPYVAHDDHPDP